MCSENVNYFILRYYCSVVDNYYRCFILAVFEALYDYDGEREGDLQFRAGDRISVTNQAGNWWTGTLNGHTGVFPSNYVQPVRAMSPVSSTTATVGSPKTGEEMIIIIYKP